MKAVLFDLGHTLIDYCDDWNVAERSALDSVFPIISNNSSMKIAQTTFDDYLLGLLHDAQKRKDTEMIEVPLGETLSICLNRYGCLEEDILNEVMEAFYHVLNDARRLVEGAPEMLSNLKDRGLDIGLVSDVAWGLPSDYPKGDMVYYGLDQYFDDMVFSTDVGLRKPGAKIFKVALNNLSVSASEAIFVGNSLHHDIKGAKGVGMMTVLKRSQFCPQDNVIPDRTISSLSELDEVLDDLGVD